MQKSHIVHLSATTTGSDEDEGVVDSWGAAGLERPAVVPGMALATRMDAKHPEAHTSTTGARKLPMD